MDKFFKKLGAATVAVLMSQVSAQNVGDYEVPRTIDGHPDLQGVWENNTITPVERPDVFGDKEYLTDEDVEFLTSRLNQIESAGEDALFGEGVLQAIFAGEITSYDDNTLNLKRDKHTQLVYKNAISTIMPIDPIAVSYTHLTLPTKA